MGVIIDILYTYVFITFLRSVIYYSVGFLFFKPKFIKQKWFKHNSKPLVSIIIPAWNEEIGILKTVKSCVSQSYKNLEIIVVNDGSKDNTSQVVTDYINKSGNNRIKLIDKENGGKWSALNTGIVNSKGKWIVTIDADSYVEHDAIMKCMLELDESEYMAGFGTIKIGNQDNIIEKVQVFEYELGFHLRKFQSLMNCVSVLPGAFSVFRRDFFDIVGFYDGSTCVEDMELCVRAKYHIGIKMKYIQDAVCVTECPTNFGGLIKQRFRWKKGLLHVLLKHYRLLFSLKNKEIISFTFFELPMIFVSLFELAIYPIFLVVIIYSAIFLTNILESRFLIFYLFYSITLTLILSSILFNKNKLWLLIPFTPLIFSFTYIVEFVALIKALISNIRNQKYQWTVWQRKGI